MTLSEKEGLSEKQCESELVGLAFEVRRMHFPLQTVKILYISKISLCTGAPP